MARRSSEVLGAIRGRQRWSAQVAGVVLDAASRSGLPLRDFAAQYEIDPERLDRWRRKLTHRAWPEEPLQFEEVPIPRARESVRREDDRIEVVLLSGHVVRLGASFDEVVLRRLLSVLDMDTQAARTC